MNECFVFTQNARKHCSRIVGTVFRPCCRYKKQTKPSSWPINVNLCPASWLRVTARLPSWSPYTPASFTAYAHIPDLLYGIYVMQHAKTRLFSLNLDSYCIVLLYYCIIQ